MMYSDELEDLIEAALIDGELTPKERQILMRRAEEEDIDLDEFEMVLNARLYKAQQAQAAHAPQPKPAVAVAAAAAPQAKPAKETVPPVPLVPETPKPQPQPKPTNKHGEMRKCPNCGAPIGALQAKCPACGYEFVNADSNHTAQRLIDQLNQIDRERTPKGIKEELLSQVLQGEGGSRKAQLIRNFPIPNTKEDIVEFITLATTQCKVSLNDGPEAGQIASAWRAKAEQVIMKANVMFKDDKDVQALITEYQLRTSRRHFSNWSPLGKLAGIWVLMMVACLFLIMLMELLE